MKELHKTISRQISLVHLYTPHTSPTLGTSSQHDLDLDRDDEVTMPMPLHTVPHLDPLCPGLGPALAALLLQLLPVLLPLAAAHRHRQPAQLTLVPHCAAQRLLDVSNIFGLTDIFALGNVLIDHLVQGGHEVVILGAGLEVRLGGHHQVLLEYRQN